MKSQVLIVDDSSTARRRLRQVLENGGFNVIEAEDGMAALEQYSVEKPDVVLLDLVMKGMYGLEVLKKLRQIDRFARVIVATADVQSSTRELAEQEGAYRVLNKPFNADQVLDAVQMALQERKNVVD